MKTIEEIIDSGCTVQFYSQLKRMSITDEPNDRGWHIRICWKLDWKYGQIESKWEGFKTAKEAIEDVISTVNNFKQP